MCFKILLIFSCLSGFKVAGNPEDDPNFIPDYLWECYQSPIQLMPMTMRTLIDITRKIESNPNVDMNLRMEVNSILSRYWRDGIGRNPNVAKIPHTWPFSGDGEQFYKYALLRQLVPLRGSPLFPDDTLTINERCTLHQMLSSGVEIWERGDEFAVCPLAEPQRQETSVQLRGAKKSSCPVEKGVVLTGFGTLSPNHVLLGVAAAFQRMDVGQRELIDGRRRLSNFTFAYDKTVDNFLAATLAGDLSEVSVFQLPLSDTPRLGPTGYWNDQILPDQYYLKTDYVGVLKGFYQCTDAEMLGGIDGIMMGNQIVGLVQNCPSLRLSQALEMLYSERGAHFPNQPRACNRRTFVEGALFRSTDVLKEQTTNFAELLAAKSVNFIANSVFVSKHQAAVFRRFKDHVTDLVSQFATCPEKTAHSEPKVRLNVIYDATWDLYKTLQILMEVSRNFDVSQFGSSVTVINGVSGYEVISQAKTTGELYVRWMSANNSVKDAKSIDLTKGFLKLKNIVESENFQNSKFEPVAHVTIVLARTSLLTDAASTHITSTLTAIKSEIPDMRFVYVIKTPDSRPWVKLTSLPHSQNDEILTMDDDNLDQLYSKFQILEDAPASIIPPACNSKYRSPTASISEQYMYYSADYITPGVPKTYMIHPAYFCSSWALHIQVENLQYGDVMFCVGRTPFEPVGNPDCASLGNYEKHVFKIDNPCSSHVTTGPHEDWDSNCKPIYIRGSVLKSSYSCFEKECRFVDQIKSNLKISGMHCLEDALTCSGVVIHQISAGLVLISYLAVLIANIAI